jgi:hypothetical protein
MLSTRPANGHDHVCGYHCGFAVIVWAVAVNGFLIWLTVR